MGRPLSCEIGNETCGELKVLSDSGYSCGLEPTILWPRPLVPNGGESQDLVTAGNAF